MDRNKEFIKNSIILFLGRFSTQLISFLCLPIYTHFLLTKDYGYVDLLQTYILLFIPIVTLRLDSVAFRFLVDKRNNNEEEKNVITNLIFLLILTLIITIILFLILVFYVYIKYNIYLIINLLFLSLTTVLLQLLRGLKKIKEYSICCIITAISTLILNILFIIILKMNAGSILLASSIANFIALIYILFTIKDFKNISRKLIKKSYIKEMLDYSVPMIVDALSWWIVNVSDRTIISFFLGTAMNGIYAVSSKLSNILNSFFLIFNMSWQESVMSHYKDEDGDIFISNLGNNILTFFSTISLIILSILPFIFNIVIGNKYVESYNYIPILLYANLSSVFSTLIGSIFIAFKKTKIVAKTTAIAAILNIIINVILIKHIGLYAATISTLVSYTIMGILRYIKCRKYINYTLNYKFIIIFTSVFILCGLCYLYNNILINIVSLIFVIIFSYLINRKNVKSILKMIKHSEKNK